MLFDDALKIIGNTPMIKLKNSYKCNVYLKLEKYNLTGSSKDRAVKNMILEAIKDNKINKDTVVIEATSGNTGISLASICAMLKLKCIIVMPNNANQERIKLIKMLGAKVILTDADKQMKGCINKVKQLLKEIKNSYYLSQFNNKHNMLAHYQYTAKEIIDEVKDVDAIFVAGGTYGSLQGISKYIKEFNGKIKVIYVRPKHQKHRINGVYSNVSMSKEITEYIDKTICVEDLYSINMVRKIAQNEGITLGLSSGLAIAGLEIYLKKNKLNNAVVFCPDGLDRYMSNSLIFDTDYDIEKDIKYIHKIMFGSNEFYLDKMFQERM